MLKIRLGLIATTCFVTMISFQNCGRFSAKNNVDIGMLDSSSQSADDANNILQAKEVFRTTVYAVVVKNCAGCHGAILPPLFAQSDLDSAYQIAKNGQNSANQKYADFSNISKSLFIEQSKNNHCGSSSRETAQFCTADGSEMLAAIKTWSEYESKITVVAPLPPLANLPPASKCTTNANPSFPRRAWRLTGQQYINSIKAIFPTVQTVNNPFANETVPGVFNNNSSGLNIGPLLTISLIEENRKIGNTAAANLITTYPCLSAAASATCSTNVVNGIIPRLFRRPLTAVETSTYTQFLTSSITLYGANDGVSAFLQAGLLSPNFLFRYEVGDRTSGILDAYELASLISFSAADTTPDDVLLNAAKSGILKTRDQIKSQYLRLAKKSGRFEFVVDFLHQYLHYNEAATKSKSTSLFPNYNAQVAKALVDETDALVIEKMRSGVGSLKELLSTNDVMVQPLTAEIYSSNISNLPTGMTLVKDMNRSGLLTQPSFLAATNAIDRTSPVHIGKTIRTELLCGVLGSAPILAPPLDDIPVGLFPTQRERLAAHSKPACIGCHKYMDPIGFGFENFDAIGAVRTMEGGKPVNDNGEITLTNTPTDGPFKGGADLGRILATSDLVRSCFMKKSFIYITGQATEAGSDCFVEKVRNAVGGGSSDQEIVGIFSDIFTEFLLAPRVGVLEN